MNVKKDDEFIEDFDDIGTFTESWNGRNPNIRFKYLRDYCKKHNKDLKDLTEEEIEQFYNISINEQLFSDVIETLSENREVTFENEKDGFYLHISFEPPNIPIACDIDGYEIKRYNAFSEILEEYNINVSTINKYNVEMY